VLRLFVLWRLFRLMRLLMLAAATLAAVVVASHGHHLTAPSFPSSHSVDGALHSARGEVQRLFAHVFSR
jgi:hypothetical protein